MTAVIRDHEEVIENIMEFSDIRTIQNLRSINPTYDNIGGRLLNIEYNNALNRFVDDAPAFRSILRAIGAVLSGSFALHFLDRDRAPRWSAKDLDIYVAEDYGRRLVYYLTNVEFYGNLFHKTRQYPHSFGGFSTVISLSRRDIYVDIIISTSSSSLLPISHFWGSHVVNYLSADTFCIAYPLTTLQGRSLIHPGSLIHWQHMNPFVLTLVEKYRRRGYDFRIRPTAWIRTEDPVARCDGGEGCPRTTRYFGDEFCLVGSFHGDAVWPMPPGGLPSPKTILWWRGGDACGGECEFTPDDLSTFVPHSRTLSARPLLQFGLANLPL